MRENILAFIEGVLFLTGDIHLAIGGRTSAAGVVAASLKWPLDLQGNSRIPPVVSSTLPNSTAPFLKIILVDWNFYATLAR
ncbi:MAG: hypothetical protein GY822_10050 [Deltaproteobacteria bacterium]|nr:hypothetical protein [Deltaproteobacteria bacterium]